MKVDFSQPISIRGINVHFTEGKDATLGEACRIALNAQSDSKRSIEQMVKIGRLALSIAEADVVDISPEDITEIRKRLPDAFPSPELVVTIYDMLDPKAETSDVQS